MVKEVQIAAGVSLPEKTVLELGELTPFTCPECHGTLIRIKEGNGFRFRCHTGHGFTSDALLEDIMQTVGELIWQTQRGFQEASMLLEHIGHHMLEQGEAPKAKVFLAKALELNQRASAFQRIAIGHESLSEEKLQEPQPEESEADD
jgi:two-component system chemotaxis response regulator CheB